MIVAGIMPQAEFVHWWFASGFLVLGLLLLSEALVGPEVWGRRPWRRYLWPSFAFGMGVLMWPVSTFFTNSTIHMVAHSMWAQVLMLAGAAELGVARGKLHSQYWRLTSALGLAASGVALLLHEQNHWLFSRAAFLHHTLGWTVLVAAVFPLVQAIAAALVHGRDGIRDDVRRGRRAPLLRPRRRTDLRPPVVLRRDPAPVRRLGLLTVVLAALAFPAAAFAHASLLHATPTLEQRLARARLPRSCSNSTSRSTTCPGRSSS